MVLDVNPSLNLQALFKLRLASTCPIVSNWAPMAIMKALGLSLVTEIVRLGLDTQVAW